MNKRPTDLAKLPLVYESTSIRKLLTPSSSPSSVSLVHHPRVNVLPLNTPLASNSLSSHHSDPGGITSSSIIFEPASRLHVAATLCGFFGRIRLALGIKRTPMKPEIAMAARRACNTRVFVLFCWRRVTGDGRILKLALKYWRLSGGAIRRNVHSGCKTDLLCCHKSIYPLYSLRECCRVVQEFGCRCAIDA